MASACNLFILVIGALFIAQASCQTAAQLLAQNPCSGKTTCGDCIRTSGCSWCYAEVFNRPRCFNPAMERGTAGCDEAFIYNPDNQRSIDPRYNREFSRAGSASASGSSSASASGSMSAGGSAAGGAFGASGEDLVQIRPQRVQLKLRMNQMQELSVSYSQAQDYPVDLYYLMDLSRSMKNDKEKLTELGNLLSTTMRRITSNFRLGFGSFVDKLVMPYVSTVPKSLISPCDNCTAPYGYINAMSLSTDTEHFTEAVSRANVSGNLDAPEGGFDAIMQAIVCKHDIGWRDQARRLLVFSTDAGFHYAGDGKLGGIIQPNDGICHLDSKGEYTHSTIQDYPSISQINLKVKEHAINVIFAVTAEQYSVYEQLSKHIEGSSAGVLSEDSANVVDLVKDQYSKITSTVEVKDNSSNAIQIQYFSRCKGNGKSVETNKCDGLKVGDVVEFTAHITLKECPKDPREWKQLFQIYPVGISDSLIIELEMLCDCPCEHPGHFTYRDDISVCSGQGVLACGVCLCNPGRFGKGCECSAAEGVSVEQERGCRPSNSTSGPLCSNRGTCICGQCDCNKMEDSDKVISGPYCECDNFTCDMNKGQMCSGPEHGVCVCGKCECHSNYSGSACQCLKDVTPCISPENGKVCGGNGQCVCGQCVCDVGGPRQYSGKYCDKCPTCPGRCAEFKDCVLCEVHKRGELYSEEPGTLECGNCTLQPIIVEGKVEANETRNEHLCSFYDDESCLYVYVYAYDETHHLTIRAQKERECPPKVFILGIVLGVIAAIVLVGLALLMLWKMVTTIHDRREFARFEKERMMAKWDTGENPIYKQATSTFKNPTYAGK